jgi:hypothetical protein
LGLTIMACVAFMPHGLVALPAQLRERLSGRNNREAPVETLEEQA